MIEGEGGVCMDEHGASVSEYKYLVAYTVQYLGRTSVNRCEVTLTWEVQSMADIEEIEQSINKQQFKGKARNLIVLGVQRFPI